MRRDCESKAHIHSAAVMLHWCVKELIYFGEVHYFIEFFADLAPGHAEDGPVEEDVLAARELRVEAGADLQEARDPPAQAHAPRSRLRDAAQNFEYGALAGTVLADDANDLTALHVEAHVLERPEFLDLVALNDLPTMEGIDRLACEVACFAGDHVAERHIALALSAAMANEVAL